MLTDLTDQVLVAESGVKYKIGKPMAHGGQGVVYKASVGRKKYVVKLYKKEGEAALPGLRWLQKQTLPRDFILPIDIFSSPHIGYAMELVTDHMPLQQMLVPGNNMAEWFNAETGGLRKRLYLGYLIALRFAQLHEKNCAYCDLSGTNILVNKNPDLVTVKLIDADNIHRPSTRNNSILGTSRYMAPEILKKQINPDTFTDDYSLAVLLFELLRCGHPYVGDLVLDGTPEEEELAYQGYFPYVDDELNDANRSQQMLPADVMFTTELKNLFKKTFVTAKDQRITRPRAMEYAIACLEASNKLVKCTNCGYWFYAKPSQDPRNPSKKICNCPWCDNACPSPIYLNFQDRFYQVDKNGKKYPKGTKSCNSYVLREDRNLVPEQYLRSKTGGQNKKTDATQQVPSSFISRNRSLEPKFILDVRYSEDGHFYLKSPEVEVVIQRGKKAIKVNGSDYERLEIGDLLRFPSDYRGVFELDGKLMVMERVAYLHNGDKNNA